jgi:hypothetical protein
MVQRDLQRETDMQLLQNELDGVIEAAETFESESNMHEQEVARL